jgi:hypothetical protein
MKQVKFYMVLQWFLFLPIILPLCVLFGALQGAFQMVERVLNQMMTDVSSEAQPNETIA